jgi:hypothetical protein
VDAAPPAPEPLVSPLMQRTLHILLTSLRLRIPLAWKSVQLSVVMLWNAAVQSGGRAGDASLVSAEGASLCICEGSGVG